MKRKVFILCQFYYLLHENCLSIGGIETYIYNLCNLICELGMDPIVIQYSDEYFEKEVGNCKVYGIDVSKFSGLKRKNIQLINKFEELADSDSILIYSTEELATRKSQHYSISIQHGISWDIESEKKVGRAQNIFNIIKRAIRAIQRTNYLTFVDKCVCVDYNFINWYRSQVKHPEMEYKVIPNFSRIPEEPRSENENKKITILFARRFQRYRGTRIFANAIEKLMLHQEVEVIFAGDGPDKEYLTSKFKDKTNVQFITYAPWESIEVHRKADIAIIPTVGSEGTSLSLLEAMAAQCAIICTNVGGMTNVILDGYNGVMINPDEEELCRALETLVGNKEYRKELARNAYETVKTSFSIEKWKESWKKVILQSK